MGIQLSEIISCVSMYCFTGSVRSNAGVLECSSVRMVEERVQKSHQDPQSGAKQLQLSVSEQLTS